VLVLRPLTSAALLFLMVLMAPAVGLGQQQRQEGPAAEETQEGWLTYPDAPGIRFRFSAPVTQRLEGLRRWLTLHGQQAPRWSYRSRSSPVPESDSEPGLVSSKRTATAYARAPLPPATEVRRGRVDSSPERRVLAQVNDLRRRGISCGQRGWFAPTTPLVADERLERSARSYARELAKTGHFSHVGVDGRGVPERLEEAGYRDWSAVGENLAAGQESAVEVVAAWVESDDHCANLMNPRFRHIGVGLYESGVGYDRHWVQHFGRERDRREPRRAGR